MTRQGFPALLRSPSEQQKERTTRTASFQCLQVSHDVVNVLIRVFVEQLVMHHERIVLFDLQIRCSPPRAVLAGGIAYRNVEIVETLERSGYCGTGRGSNGCRDLRPKGKEKSLLQQGRIEPLSDACEVAGWRMAGVALPRAIEIRSAGLRIARKYVLNLIQRRASKRIVDALLQKVREIRNLSLREVRARLAALCGMAVAEERSDFAAEPIPQNRYGPD